MGNIKITPKAISKLLDLDLEYVIYKITGKNASRGQKYDLYQKELKAIKRTYGNSLYELDALPNFVNENAVSLDLQNKCILRELVNQCNKYPVQLMKKISENKKCVDLIKFTEAFSYYDLLLEDDNKNLILKKLANMHFQKYGETKIYKEFLTQ